MADEATGTVQVVITPTYSGCPAMDVIARRVEHVARRSGWAATVATQLTPAWTTDWMSAAGRDKLRDAGIAPPGARAAEVAPGPVHVGLTVRRVDLPPVRLRRHARDRAVRLHRVQGPAPLQRLPRALRRVQGDLMTTLLTTTTPQRHRARFHALTVSAVERLTDDAVAVSFAVPQDLADEFVFAPGQHLTLRATIEGQDTRRSYSICRSPQEVRRLGELRVAASRVEGGLMSSWLNDTVRVGDTVQVMTPLGSLRLPHRPRRGPSPRRDRRRLGHHPGDVAAHHGAGAGARSRAPRWSSATGGPAR